MTSTTPTTHTNLALHLERHKYKRGMYKNAAPLDKNRRYRNHVRVLRRNDNAMVVRMYSTDILTAYEDGRIVIDTRGWYSRPTTKARLNEALGFVPFNISIGSWSIKSLTQTVLRVNRTLYKYFDEIELDGEGNILSDLHGFDARHTDKDEAELFRKDIEESGFKAVFPVLAANVEDNNNRGIWNPSTIVNAITQECHANDWAEIVARYAFVRNYPSEPERLTAKQTWARLMSDIRKEFMTTSVTDITSIQL
jgi:hypothetical protein